MPGLTLFEHSHSGHHMGNALKCFEEIICGTDTVYYHVDIFQKSNENTITAERFQSYKLRIRILMATGDVELLDSFLRGGYSNTRQVGYTLSDIEHLLAIILQGMCFQHVI